MNIYESQKDDVVEDLIAMLEKDTGQSVFTLKVLERVEDGLEVVVVFEDKSVLMGLISVQDVDGKMACRMRGNYI